MPNLECPHFVESESSTWAVKFDRIWSLEFREIQLTELSNILVSLTRPQSSSGHTGDTTPRERWVPRKGAQGEMGREKTKEEDDVFTPSPFPSSSALAPCYIKTTGDVSGIAPCLNNTTCIDRLHRYRADFE